MSLSQRELESKLWAAADSLRGPVDPSDYKAYIFPLLFLKWINDHWEWEYERALGELDGDQEAAKADLMFQIPDNCFWDDLRRTPENLGQRLQEILDEIERANPDRLTNIFGTVDWANKDRLPEANLRNLIGSFDELRLGPDHVSQDVLGAAYEYLLKQFADATVKKAGEFFTPRAVVHLLTKILDPQPGESLYDPTCGSGGMLVEAINELKARGENPRALKLHGQEVNLTTLAIARMNLYLHGIEDADIRRGDTLRNPRFLDDAGRLQHFDCVIANPPFSLSNWGQEGWADDPYGRGRYGVPPAGNGDFAFIEHMVSSLKAGSGRMAVVMPHGVLFRGASEKSIRQQMIQAGLLEAVIGLPTNLFYNTSIPACVLIMRATPRPELSEKVLFVDASKRFAKERNQNTMSDEDIQAIVTAYRRAVDPDGEGTGVDIAMVATSEIEANDWDLSIGRYVKGVDAAQIDVPTAIAAFKASSAALREAEAALLLRLREAGYEA